MGIIRGTPHHQSAIFESTTFHNESSKLPKFFCKQLCFLILIDWLILSTSPHPKSGDLMVRIIYVVP